MELKSRQGQILRCLCSAKRGIALAQLMEDFSISRRTLYYDLQQIHAWQCQNGLGYTQIVDSVAQVVIRDPERMEQLLTGARLEYFPAPERRALELLYITLSDEPVTIGKMTEVLAVSKNTILTDIRAIREELIGWELTLAVTTREGYQITGEEAAVRKLLRRQLQTLGNPAGENAVKELLQRSLEHLTGNEIDFFELCRCIIRQYEIDTESEYILSDITYESMMIQVSWIRSMKGHSIELRSEELFTLMKTLAYRSLEISIQKLRLHNIGIAPIEAYYIASLFLGIQTTDFHSQKEEDSFIWNLSGKMISDFERIACLSFVDRNNLQRQLAHHIRPMYYRLKYGIPSDNPLAKNVQQMYPVVFDFTKRMYMQNISDMPSGISDGELAYLCIYFVNNLNEDQVTQGAGSEDGSILILGVENMATATLLKMQIQHLLGGGFRYSVMAKEKLRAWMLNDYAMIVSVGALPRGLTCDHLVEIGGILTEQDQERMLAVLQRGNALIRYDKRIMEIMQIVGRNAEGVQKHRLYFELLQYFENSSGRKGTVETVELFYERIKPGQIQGLPRSAVWTDAVLAGAASIAGRNRNSRLTDRVQNLLGKGNLRFYRMQKDAILIHYPVQGDLGGRLDITVHAAKDGILCPDGKTATVFVGLATVDNYAHWAVLEEIYRYFDLAQHIRGIQQMYQTAEDDDEI